MADDHIVDILIAERAPKIAAAPWWPLVRPMLYALLGYKTARYMADEVAKRSGAEAMLWTSNLLGLKLEVIGAENIARTGRLVAVSNHPTGITDGLAMYDTITPIRPDAIFFANADALRVNPRFAEVVIPVEWVESKRTREKTRETLNRAKEALEQERLVVVFPAGRLAQRQEDGSLSDPPWATSAVSLARKYEAPIVPIHMAGPWSTLFHFFGGFSQELRDITLFHEMLNKKGKTYRLTIGAAIPPDRLGVDGSGTTLALKHFVERELATDPKAVFR